MSDDITRGRCPECGELVELTVESAPVVVNVSPGTTQPHDGLEGSRCPGTGVEVLVEKHTTAMWRPSSGT